MASLFYEGAFSAFVMVSTVWLFAVLLLTVPPCPAICKSGARASVPWQCGVGATGLMSCLPSVLVNLVCQPPSIQDLAACTSLLRKALFLSYVLLVTPLAHHSANITGKWCVCWIRWFMQPRFFVSTTKTTNCTGRAKEVEEHDQKKLPARSAWRVPPLWNSFRRHCMSLGFLVTFHASRCRFPSLFQRVSIVLAHLYLSRAQARLHRGRAVRQHD